MPGGRRGDSVIDAALRRLLDVLVAAVVLLITAPILLVAAIAVGVSSRGSILYGAPRAGRDGREFRMWKFRTMRADAAEVGGPITAPGDSRITGIGAILRKTKIDELPQLANVLIGQMSLVGPRPEDPGIVRIYTPRQRQTLDVRPGVTGPGSLFYEREQVASIPEGAAAESYYVEHLLGPKLEVDLDYLERRTVWTDLGVLAETVGHMFGSLRNRSEG